MAKFRERLQKILSSNIFFGVLVAILILFDGLAALEKLPFSVSSTWLWILNMLLILVFTVVIGKGITGRWLGFLIDDRIKRISLSRFQLVLWTIIIVPALLSAIIINLANAPDAPPNSRVKDDPLNVEVPPEVWGLLGISIVSLASSEYIKGQNTDDKVLDQAAPNPPAPNPPDQGDPTSPRFADMFRGETESSKGFLEIGKVQMFFFTLIVALGYAMSIGDTLALKDSKVIEALPVLSAGMLVLLGISQAGYIANKGIAYSATPTTTDAVPQINNVLPNPIDFDRDDVLTVEGVNFGQDPNSPPKGTVLLDGRVLTTRTWTPNRIEANLPTDKPAATAHGFTLPSSADVVVQDNSGRRSQPWQHQLPLS